MQSHSKWRPDRSPHRPELRGRRVPAAARRPPSRGRGGRGRRRDRRGGARPRGCAARLRAAAQALGFQAGYSYVNMVDPTSEADTSILNVIFALTADLLFLATDMHLFALRALIDGLRVHPLGSFVTRPADALMMIELGGYML